jgi:hypothetical protein
MSRVVSRPDLGSQGDQHRDFFFTRSIQGLQRAIGLRPVTAASLVGVIDRSRRIPAYASWFAKGSRLLLDGCRVHGEACLAYALLASGEAGAEVSVMLEGTTVNVQRQPKVNAPMVIQSVGGWCAALGARDDATLDGLASISDALYRRAPASLDEYQYGLKRALFALRRDPAGVAEALAQGRALWQRRKVAQEGAAAIDGKLFDVVDALARNDARAFNDALYEALLAHQVFWSQGTEYLNPLGWFALRHVGLACWAHDRGITVEVESDYLPRALIERRFSDELGLELAPPDTAPAASPPASVSRPAELRAEAAALTRKIALAAGETFGRLKLEPEGYKRVTIDRKLPFTFDLVYQKEPDDVVLVDTLAADETSEGFQADGGAIVRPGTRPYVAAAADRLKAKLPDLAASIQSALAAGKLRYYEVRQPIDAQGKLETIQIRQFKL